MEITGNAAYRYMSEGTSSASEETGSSSTLGKDQFLQLLATQLKYQDPLNPMSNDQFIAQMAQFSSLEQIQNLNTTMESYAKTSGNMSVMNLLGTQVEAKVSTTTGGVTSVEEISGVVYKIDLSGSEPKLYTLEGKSFKLSEITQTSIPVTEE
ncbi:MAG TPA: flagellar hook capping FlgD N-terminal domain-containing protein [bacterium]|nr:flagellar hook capping FlgD N-terminal domain-containing protein [bacterium]